jgi:hypothetical protein
MVLCFKRTVLLRGRNDNWTYEIKQSGSRGCYIMRHCDLYDPLIVI